MRGDGKGGFSHSDAGPADIMPDARQHTRISASSSAGALVGITHQLFAYTHKPDKEEDERKDSLGLTEFVRKAPLPYPGSVSSTTCAMRAQLSRLCADCNVSCAKRSTKRMVAALKSCMMSGAVIERLVVNG